MRPTQRRCGPAVARVAGLPGQPEGARAAQLGQRAEKAGHIVVRVRQVVRFQARAYHRGGKDLYPVGQRHDRLFGDRIVTGPVLDVLFRPEEIHTASTVTKGYFARQQLGERGVDVAHRRQWVHFQDLVVLHADDDRLPAVQAAGVESDLGAREKPAHG
jgi:hypothetical protein